MIYIDVDTAVEVPVNVAPLIDDTDFKTRETAIAYNQAGMDLVWNFVTPAGTITQTAVTPTTAGDYDWAHVGDGMYKIEIPASGGASINNDTEGVGYFSGICTGVLPWRGPDIVFRAAALNDAMIEGGDNLDVNVTQWKGSTAPAMTGDAFAYLGTNLGALGANATEAGGTGDHLTAVPWNASWDSEVQSEVNDGLTAFWTSPATLVDLVWDEVITGAAHNVNNSAAKFLREGSEATGVTGTAQSATSTTITLASGAVTATNIFNFERIRIIEGTGAGQSRLITTSTITTDVCDVHRAWTTTPDSTSVYVISSADAAVNAVDEQLATATGTVDFDDLATINDTKLPQALNLTASGNIGIDWANVENPTTAVDLSATDIQLCDTVTTNTDMRGTDSAALASNVPDSLSHANLIAQLVTGYGLDHLVAASVAGTDVVDNSIFAKIVSSSATADWDTFVNTTDSLQAVRDKQTDIEADTNELQGDWANGGRLDLIIDELTTQGDTNEAAIAALNDPTAAAIATAVFTTQITESYRSANAAPTVAQALCEIINGIHEFAISSTTKTVKKFDGSTTAKTYTLDDATSPTSITETT